MEQSRELRTAHEAAKAIHEGLQAAHVLKKQARIATQELARLRDSDTVDVAAVHAVNQRLSRYAFASGSALKKYRQSPAQPQEAQHGNTDRQVA